MNQKYHRLNNWIIPSPIPQNIGKEDLGFIEGLQYEPG